MCVFAKLETINRIHRLIERRATGDPKQLAEKLDYSESKLYRLLNEMKSKGFPIEYCYQSQSYKYYTNFTFNYEFKAPEVPDPYKLDNISANPLTDPQSPI